MNPKIVDHTTNSEKI